MFESCCTWCTNTEAPKTKKPAKKPAKTPADTSAKKPADTSAKKPPKTPKKKEPSAKELCEHFLDSLAHNAGKEGLLEELEQTFAALEPKKSADIPAAELLIAMLAS